MGKNETTEASGRLQILVLPRGWVIVGYVTDTPGPRERVVVERAAVVRRWGTDRGLPQLAAEGPTPDTKLDASSATGYADPIHVIWRLECDEARWRDALPRS